MTTTKNNEHKKLNFSSEREQSQVCLNSAEHEKNQGRKVLNVPNLRFPEFQGEWEKHELGDICETITDFVAAGSFASLRENVKYYQEDNFAQLVRTVDLKKDFTNNDFVYVDEFAYDFLWRVQLKEPNIVLPNIGANIGEKYYVSTKDLPKEKNVLGPNAILLRSKCNDTHFVYFRLSTSSYDNEMKKLVGASGQPKFNKTDLKKVRLFMPSLKEQKKISYFLGLLEERIATQNKIIDKLQSLIKGLRVSLMQIENGNIVHLGEIAQIYQPQTISSTELTEDGFLVYGANGIIGKYKQYNHKTEQICITCRGNTCGTVNYTKPMSWITGNAMVINTDEHQNKVCKRYLYHYLSAYNFNSIISGSGQPQIVRTPLEQLKVPLPTFLEQKQKATFLDKIQDKIEISNKTLDLYLQQKQYLLRLMFI